MLEFVITRIMPRHLIRFLATRKHQSVSAVAETIYVLVMGFANGSGVTVSRVTIQAIVPTFLGMLLQYALKFAIMIKQGKLKFKHLIDLEERILTCHPL